MRCRFLHFGDVHLGFQQYGSKERFNDFTRAYMDVIRRAIDARVDFVIMAGDLFQKRTIDALTLRSAMAGLERLAQAGIPCIGVEGNHELAYYREAMGWMQFLAQRELITLLNVPFDQGQAQLTPYEIRQGGAYCEPLPGVRVYGLRYQGSATAAAIKSVGEALAQQPRDGIDYTIFVAHAGMENVLPGHTAGLSHAQVAPLRPHVDYLALGHVHKPYAFDNWIYNPGSPESCSMEEVAWADRGYYLVDVDTARRTPEVPAHLPVLQANRRRPFHRLLFKVDLCESPEMLLAQCADYIRRQARDLNASPDLPREEQPVVELRLSGVLPFDRTALVTAPLEELIHELFGPLLCQIKNQTTPAAFSVVADANLNRRELEAQIIGDLLSRDARFRENQAEWTRLLLEIKRLALTNASPESIVDTLARMTD